jgi:hypothetical protein
MFALSDQQLKTVTTAAALLPVNARDTFLRRRRSLGRYQLANRY